MKLCTVRDCQRSVFSREWCQKHYTRWLRHGDPTATQSTRDLSIDERIDRQVMRRGQDDCWPWTGALNDAGYAIYHCGVGRSTLVHRYMYEREIGPIPSGLQLDHVCHTRDTTCTAGRECPHRRCVNPSHAEPVTSLENTRRGRAPSVVASQLNECKRGHDLAVHGYARKDKAGRNCLACQRITSQARRDRLKAGVSS